MPDTTPPKRPARPIVVLAAVALALAFAALAFRWWDRSVEDRLGRWAVGEITRRTDSTYHLALGDLSFLPLAGSISFDSAVVSTDSVRNRRRRSPLPALEWRARGCRVSGLDVVRLVFRRSFVARELGCDRVVAGIALPSREEDEGRPASDSAGSADPPLDLARPLGLSSFEVADVSLPALSLTLERLGRRGGTSIRVEHARFEAKDLLFEPTREHSRAAGSVGRPGTPDRDGSGSALRHADRDHDRRRGGGPHRLHAAAGGRQARAFHSREPVGASCAGAPGPDPLRAGQPAGAGRRLARLRRHRGHRGPRPRARRRPARRD